MIWLKILKKHTSYINNHSQNIFPVFPNLSLYYSKKSKH